MIDELDKNERFMAEIASLKLCLMAFMFHGLGQDREALQAVANTADNSIAEFSWTEAEPERIEALNEATRERVAALMSSVMNAQRLP